MKRRLLAGVLWSAVVVLGIVAALQLFTIAALIWFEPSIPLATDVCSEDIFVFVGAALVVPAALCALVVVATSIALQRPRLRKVGLGFAGGYMAALLLSFIITVGPRFGPDWAPVRAAWAAARI